MIFIPVKKKGRPTKAETAERIQIRVPRTFKAELERLASQHRTTPTKILRSYLRYCLERDGATLNIPLKKGGYYPEWMRQ